MKGIFFGIVTGFADGKKYIFLSDLTKEKTLNLLPYRKPVELIFHSPP